MRIIMGEIFLPFEAGFVCSVYIPLRNSPRETRLDNDHFESLQESIYTFSRLGEVWIERYTSADRR